MTDQVVIDFPDDVTDEEYKAILNVSRRIKVELWENDERKSFPLEWNGTRICCPITIWYDFPDNLTVVSKEGK
jgi:hypothetical protein